ncbi:hypothetical protein [Devosia sp.]|uniref:hypothetical protein n=1 Tax=Devosia sp. TaxID=1871048 RepID=UPI001ACC85AE|nr:hypothetical protein [Devosia sp.]MBN9333948.1 hypothetical protein [Devosia sp.]
MGLIEDNAQAEIDALNLRLSRGRPADWKPAEPEPRRIPKANYVLLVDELLPFALVVVIRTGEDGVTRGIVGIPEYQDLPEFHEGPFRVEQALRTADRWALRYGHEDVFVDIESSQLWDKTWGSLEIPTEGHYSLPLR